MKIRMAAWAVVMCVGLSLEGGACSGTGTSGSEGKIDAGSAERPFDSGASSDAAGDLDTAPPDTSLGSSDGGAGSCGMPHTTLGQACNVCIQTNCEPAWCACAYQAATPADAASAAGDAGTDDGDARTPDAEAVTGDAATADASDPDADAGSTDAGVADARSADGDADARSDLDASAQTDDAARPGADAASPADAASADVGSADGAATGPGCLGYAMCVEGCVADDAGSPTDCFQTVCALAAYTPTQQQAGHAFLDCLVQYCAHDCGQ